MSERHKRHAKGIDYWIDRCDLAENILENFESITNHILGSIKKKKGKYVVVDATLFEKGVGKAMLEEHVKRRRELRKRTGFFPSPFMGPPWIPHISEETSGLLEAGKRLAMSSWTLLDNLHEKLSEDVVAKATEILTDAAKQIEEMTEELSKQKDD